MRDTIDMAREVESEVGFQWCVNFIELARFEALVRADEREACAKLVEPDEDHRREAQYYIGGEEGVELLDNRAEAIRARGNT